MSKYVDCDVLKSMFEQDDDIFKSQDVRHVIDEVCKDVANVIHVRDAHWIYRSAYAECSNCHHRVYDDNYSLRYNEPFCFRCGSKMDGGIE